MISTETTAARPTTFLFFLVRLGTSLLDLVMVSIDGYVFVRTFINRIAWVQLLNLCVTILSTEFLTRLVVSHEAEVVLHSSSDVQ